jgi:hypothetical protein
MKMTPEDLTTQPRSVFRHIEKSSFSLSKLPKDVSSIPENSAGGEREKALSGESENRLSTWKRILDLFSRTETSSEEKRVPPRNSCKSTRKREHDRTSVEVSKQKEIKQRSKPDGKQRNKQNDERNGAE